MTLFKNLLGVTHIPIWIDSFVPRKSEYIVKIRDFL